MNNINNIIINFLSIISFYLNLTIISSIYQHLIILLFFSHFSISHYSDKHFLVVSVKLFPNNKKNISVDGHMVYWYGFLRLVNK